LLLRSLEQPATVRVLGGPARPFSKLGHSQREQVLLSLATSPLPQLRAGFQAIKRLVSFLFYSLPGADGDNPAWAALAYSPSRNQPAHAPILNLTRITGPTTFECDVCVVGSGAGGGVVAAEAAAAGKRVVVLEAGSGLQAPDFDQHELAGMEQLYLDRGLTATSDLGMSILAGATLGGGTAVNWQTSLPLPGDVREEWAAVSGCRHFVDDSFTRSIEAVMARLRAGTAESAVNPNNDALRRGCQALGYSWSTIARNSHNCDLEQCGSCVFGCRHGGKQSTTVTYLCDAQVSGDTRIVPHCRADRVVVRNGKAEGVRATATDPATGRSHPVVVRAGRVVLAAGSLRTPLVLFRSGVDLPAIGRNLFLHPTSAVAGIYADRIEAWSGPPQTVMSNHFAHLSGPYGFRLETAPAHPGLIALAAPWFGARDHRGRMQKAGHMSTIIVLARDKRPGRVRVGRWGQPIIDYKPGPQEQAHLRRGLVEASRVHLAAGAVEVQTLHSRRHEIAGPEIHSPLAIEEFYREVGLARLDNNWSTLFSAHQMGTCAMGTDRRRAVCGPDGQVFGVRGLYIADASAFPASSGVNPMITVMAMAHHTAQGLA
jgi:choline dehydrogenase-like flavoprotein